MPDDAKTRAPNEWEKFRAATKHVLSVSKDELNKREAAWRKKKARRKKLG